MQQRCGLMVVALIVMGITFMTWTRHIISDRTTDWRPLQSAVPIELFVMSKCPDKVDCEEVISKVLKQVKVPVSLDVNYIARPNSSESLGFECKHGPTECLGNMQELCFKNIYPDIDDWFHGFTLCLNEKYADIGEDDSLLAEECGTLSSDRCLVYITYNCTKSKTGSLITCMLCSKTGWKRL
ncbi:hypothetical protein BDB00DRAFT_845030 [Zychaea mexicana]|uniref:uncharacterized protein n=1 Tax=Zychaea mexicana TaxID=64656 RepID=UPI0022FE9FE3|nr:uncharacterized protein BDB00DRAFT_845030 [Zychaea mexicana]KAI9489183.1 hypothetical protein BDB00DRAFT_845030 [Zychaea mexicana]